MLSVSETDLHDSLINKVQFDYQKKEAHIHVEICKEGEYPKRDFYIISFYGVIRFTAISNMEEIENHRCSGNIGFWHQEVNGVTYIHLINGFIEIEAQKVALLGCDNHLPTQG